MPSIGHLGLHSEPSGIVRASWRLESVVVLRHGILAFGVCVIIKPIKDESRVLATMASVWFLEGEVTTFFKIIGLTITSALGRNFSSFTDGSSNPRPE